MTAVGVEQISLLEYQLYLRIIYEYIEYRYFYKYYRLNHIMVHIYLNTITCTNMNTMLTNFFLMVFQLRYFLGYNDIS